jgi:hypothetical protein
LFLILGAAGCAQPAEPESPAIETSGDLLVALQEAGRQVDETAILATRGELGPGRVYFVDGARLEVFEYAADRDRHRAQEAWLDGNGAAAAEEGLIVWARGRLIVALVEGEGGSIALLSGLLGDPLTLPRDAVVEPYPPAVVAALGFLAEDLGIDPGTIVVVEFEPAEWPDSCLGLGGPDETCTDGVTPGWRIELRAGDTTHILHSDQVGLVVRPE